MPPPEVVLLVQLRQHRAHRRLQLREAAAGHEVEPGAIQARVCMKRGVKHLKLNPLERAHSWKLLLATMLKLWEGGGWVRDHMGGSIGILECAPLLHVRSWRPLPPCSRLTAGRRRRGRPRPARGTRFGAARAAPRASRRPPRPARAGCPRAARCLRSPKGGVGWGGWVGSCGRIFRGVGHRRACTARLKPQCKQAARARARACRKRADTPTSCATSVNDTCPSAGGSCSGERLRTAISVARSTRLMPAHRTEPGICSSPGPAPPRTLRASARPDHV